MSKFKVGDKVLVARKIPDCKCSWVSGMDEYVGTIKIIKEVTFSGYYVLSNGDTKYVFPKEALELVEEDEIKGAVGENGSKYHEHHPFPPNKTIKELGIDITRKFEVTKSINEFEVGDILTLIRDQSKKYWFLIDPATSNKLINNNSTSNEVETKTKTMNIVKFAKDLTLSSEEKLLRKVGLKNEEGNWTEQAKEIVLDLVAKDDGYKNHLDKANKFNSYHVSLDEFHCWFDAFKEELMEIATKFEKEMDKKSK